MLLEKELGNGYEVKAGTDESVLLVLMLSLPILSTPVEASPATIYVPDHYIRQFKP